MTRTTKLAPYSRQKAFDLTLILKEILFLKLSLDFRGLRSLHCELLEGIFLLQAASVFGHFQFYCEGEEMFCGASVNFLCQLCATLPNWNIRVDQAKH